MLILPPEFNRNAANVVALGDPADTGYKLLAYMASRLGVKDLSEIDILDFGCGSRFAESIINRDYPVKGYTGVDVFKPLMDFLHGNVQDPRLRFFHANFESAYFNPGGVRMNSKTKLPVEGVFDLACMFSVITHQAPEDTKAIFGMLRRYVRPDGKMFFSASIREDLGEFAEEDPEHPGALSHYPPKLMESLLAETGWRVVSYEKRNPDGLPILDSYLCEPSEVRASGLMGGLRKILGKP